MEKEHCSRAGGARCVGARLLMEIGKRQVSKINKILRDAITACSLTPLEISSQKCSPEGFFCPLIASKAINPQTLAYNKINIDKYPLPNYLKERLIENE